MKRLWLRILSLVLAILVIGAFGAGSGFGTGKPSGPVTLDPNLPVHPILQFGAQVQPEKRVTIIVQKAPGASSQALAKAAGASIKEEFPFINGLVLEVPQRVALVLGKQNGVRYISPDSKVRGQNTIDVSNLQTVFPNVVGAPALWNSLGGPTGKGVTVAVLDSGVHGSHPDLSTGIISVSGNAKSTRLNDPHGHGTHVIGIIKGRSASGRYIGVAPNANVVSLKISDDTGASREVDLIRGLQWVYSNRSTYNIRVVNLSVSGSIPTSYLVSPISAAAEQLWRSGVVVVTASGNRGAGANTAWYPPANDPWLLAVGALDDNLTLDGSDDSIAPFSTRGITQDLHYRPDIVAPGRRVVSALSPNSTLATKFADRIVDTNYVRLSGTSMAAPVVAGVAALVLEKYPSLTPNQVKWLLVQSARPYAGMPDNAGVVDPARALQLAALGTVGSANQGLLPNQFIDATSGKTQWAQSYWDQSYWDQSYWDQSYWDSSSDYEAEATYDMFVE